MSKVFWVVFGGSFFFFFFSLFLGGFFGKFKYGTAMMYGVLLLRRLLM